MTGAVLSILKLALLMAEAALPATSVQLSEVTCTLRPSPLVVLDCQSSVRLKAASQVALTPDRLSETENWLTTSVLYQPARLGSVVGPSLAMTGAVLSILICPKEAAAAALPALSTQMPVVEVA